MSGRSDVDDTTLVARACGGDRAAMNDLLERHYDRVHAVCRRLTGSAADADDAAQETMIRVVRNLRQFDGRASFGTWIYRIATNTALDELRKRRRRPQLHVVRPDEHGAGIGEQADPRAERDVTASVDQIVLSAALSSLPADFRAPLVLRDVGDLDYAEIAEALDIPIGGREPGNRDPSGGRPTSDPPSVP